ncbi:MAG TPA: rod shape-determining protein RodA [Lachnospiraceae bacterium]|jgi:rod shape determining protein RodA|nr:rod shape-determining protein RodA [Lachnospiraceae bacterium]HCM13729.1 rod shape-determining protein RodA [Lachnospiraceae bacterium]HCR39630.1 rod shape-determining protein RodA [Lachnospiraceae bacterium]
MFNIFNLKQYDFKRYNFSLLAVVTLLVIIGSFLIKQVQRPEENLFQKQLVGLVMGLCVAAVVSLIDYHFICKFYIILYFFNLFLLIMVKLFGKNINYATRWLQIGSIQFQPSELSKIILILFLAKLFTIFEHRINSFFLIALAVITTAIPTVLILTQTDLSTSMVIMFTFVMMIFAAGLSWKIILPVLVIGIPGIATLFWYVQQDYQVLLTHTQQERVLSILHPELYPEVMYQQENSIQAIGSGQLYGKLFSPAGVRGYDYVPVSESDFIFSVAGEELGFIGCCFIILLFAILIYKCLIAGKKAPDHMGMLIGVGISSMFMFQVFANIGVATQILPNTGIPLPFLSSGLSGLISYMISIGIILNISIQSKSNRHNL